MGINEWKSKVQKSSPPVAKIRVFQPRLEASGRLELSTFCVDELEDLDRWGILDAHGDKPVVARTELKTQDVVAAGLVADPDWNPERHVNLVDWPHQEEARLAIQQKLHGVQAFVKRVLP